MPVLEARLHDQTAAAEGGEAEIPVVQKHNFEMLLFKLFTCSIVCTIPLSKTPSV